MTDHIDYGDAKYAKAAAEILRRHYETGPEANITSAVRNFLVLTNLASSEEIKEENPPSNTSRSAVDLTAHDTFVEMKRRIGNGPNPNPEYVAQLDDYLAQSQTSGKGVRMGVLTDGKHWLLRWPEAGQPKTTLPYAFTLENADRWPALYEWLRARALVSLEHVIPDRDAVKDHFGPNSPSYQRDIDALTALYRDYASYETIKVKRRLWHDLLRTALGEIARSPEEMDDLFVRHTYLTAVIGMVVQASFGIDIRQMAATDPADLLHGREFRSKTGLQGVVESDFFAWPTEVGGLTLLKTIAHRAARFDWQHAPTDIAAILYETVIPPEERRTLGEYYTPHWLARSIVRDMVDNPVQQCVLDPACGSGTFIAEAVIHFMEAAKNVDLDSRGVLEWLRISVVGIDVHPVAVHLDRAAWVLAAQPAIRDAFVHGLSDSITVPIYLGDALQLRFRTGDMFAGDVVTIPVERQEEEGRPTTFGEGVEALQLIFPMRMVERTEDFDAFMGAVADCIENGDDPYLALDDAHITDPGERQTLRETIAVLQQLHAEGRDHIWAYYTRNLVRPVALARKKVDVIIGNPPWINYNQTASILRTELERQSRNLYGIWQGGRYATHQDVAGLFFARCVDLYLKDGGAIGMVMPHSALQTGQYAKWRTGSWTRRQGLVTLSVDFSHKPAWDLERLEPNTFFPVPASVVFAKRLATGAKGQPLSGVVERWRGAAGSDDMWREGMAIRDTSVVGKSPYASHSRQGASIVPRCLFFVEEAENTAIIQAGQTTTINPRRGSQDKEPWRSLDLTAITGQTVESQHVFDGETIAPYTALVPLKAVLPLKAGDGELPVDPKGTGGIRLGGLERRMRERWRTISGLWDENKAPANKLDLLGRLDYHHELMVQLEWQRDPRERPVRVVQTQAGQPTAALLHKDSDLVDRKLYWITCKSMEEAYYILSVINSQTLYHAVSPLMSKGQFGARDLEKHLWKLPIPEFDPGNHLHTQISGAGAAAARGAAQQLEQLRQERGANVSVTTVRRELRKWLHTSPEGAAVENAVGRLLAGG